MPQPRKNPDWRNAVIALLLVAVGIFGAELFSERVGAVGGSAPVAGPEEEGVGVFDVSLDREGLVFLDVLFDRPISTDKVGEILAPPPVTLVPAVGGTWRWHDTHILRFQPTDRFAMATEYTITLIGERLVSGAQVLEGDREFRVRTDRFIVEQAKLFEQSIPGESGKVVFQGDLRFNYPIQPEELIGHIKLMDPESREVIEVELETHYRSRSVGLRTAPVTKALEARELKLVIDRNLTPARGNVPLAEDFVEAIPVGSKVLLEVRSLVAQPGLPDSTITLELSSPVDPELVAPYLEIEPEVPFRLGGAANRLTVIGAFAPGSRYRISLDAGLPGKDDSYLHSRFSADLQIDDLPSRVDFQGQGSFLPAHGARKLAIESVNVATVQLSVDRVYRNNLHFLYQYFGYLVSGDDFSRGPLQRALGDRIYEKTLDLGRERNRPQERSIDLGSIVQDESPGLYRVGLLEAGEWYGQQRWILITDIGMIAKAGRNELSAWLWSFDDLSPLVGVQVELRSEQNQVLARGRTDNQGYWQVRDLDPKEGQAFLLTASKGDDFSFLHLPHTRIDTSGLDVAGRASGKDGYSAFLYGDRDIYRPGETLHGVALVRDGALSIPPTMPLRLVHRDPLGRELETLTLEADDAGLTEYTLHLAPEVATGHHVLELLVADEVIGQRRFQVEEFIPDRIRVQIDSPNTKPFLGEHLEFSIRGAYLFGPPAAGLEVESRVRLEPTTFSPPGYASYSFVNSERSFQGREIFVESGKLDNEGSLTTSADLPEFLQPPSGLEARIMSRVQEQGGRGVTALRRVRIDPYPRYVGLRREADDFPEPGQAVELSFVVLDGNGEKTQSEGLRADLFRDSWHSNLRRTSSGGYRYTSTRESRLVDTQSVMASNEGSFSFTPSELGTHRVVLSDLQGGASSQVTFYTGGWGYSPWALQNPGRLELALDRDEYAPGDHAVLQVRAPFSGRLLVTVEREILFDRQVHVMPGNTATVEIPIRSHYRPNAFVTATVVRKAAGLKKGESSRAFGVLPLNVDRVANLLHPEIEVPEEIRPETDLQIRVRTAPGATVTLAAVDEGILQLIAQKTPDPFEYFYRRRSLEVRSHDIFSLLLPEIEGLAEAGGGFGEPGMQQYVRSDGIRRVEPVSLWSGPLKADASGWVSTRFQMPRFQGAVRVMAVASEGRLFGSSASLVRVRDPIVLLPTLPRFLAVNDLAQIPVTLRNDSGKKGSFSIHFETSGEGSVIGAATQAVDLEHGSEGTIYFRLAASASPGQLDIALRAEGQGASTRESITLPVRAALPLTTREEMGSFLEEETLLEEEVSGEFLPSTTSRVLRIGPTPLIQLSGKLEDLLRYPYGCLEQSASRIFPLLYLGDLAKDLEPELFDIRDPASLVAVGLRRISAMQLPSGAFSFWPGGRHPHPWGSLYATHLLVEARTAGHHVAAASLERALDYLARGLRAKPRYGAAELAENVYALYILARAGRSDTGTMDFIRERHLASLEAEQRALLAAAYASLGNSLAVERLVGQIQDVERVERQTGGQFASTLRNRALLLLAMLDATPKDPRIAILADRIARGARLGQPWTTQESGLALMALGRLAHLQGQKGGYSGTVSIGDKEVAQFGDDPVTLEIPGDLALTVRMHAGYTEGAAYYSLRTRGVPTDETYRSIQDGLQLRREWLSRNGDPVDLQALRHGELLVLRLRLRSLSGPIENVALQSLLPAGFEIENTRLVGRESLPWLTADADQPTYLDLRDHQLLLFTDLPADEWQTYLALVRAVNPGQFRLPPYQVEAMYAPHIRASGQIETVTILRDP